MLDVNKTVIEISQSLNCGTATVARWRQKLGIKVSRGSKPGNPRPWQLKPETRYCVLCNSEFITTPKSVKRYCSLRCSTKNIDKSYMQSDTYRASLRKSSTPEYKKYRNRVGTLTEMVYRKHREEINPNGYIRGRAGVTDAYHLDHKISIRYGFDNNMSPEDISKLENLQMLPWKDNIVKGKKLV